MRIIRDNDDQYPDDDDHNRERHRGRDRDRDLMDMAATVPAGEVGNVIADTFSEFLAAAADAADHPHDQQGNASAGEH
ncbi:MAG: hypothetical protein J2P18_07495, partial [Nocardia sp.]|nr:hypothetical protein [Nocardia sp.]